jgi:hypothetical protein
VRRARAGGGDDPRQHLARDIGDLHGAELVADQDGVGHVLDRRRGQLLQMGQDAATQIADVGGALAQVGIVHVVEHLRVLGDGLAQGTGRPVARADPREGPVDQGVALEHQAPGVEQGHVFGTEMRLGPHREAIQILGHMLHRTEKILGLVVEVLGAPIRNGVQVGRRVDHHGGPDADAGRGRQAGQEALRDPVILQTGQLAVGARKGDGAGQLRGQGHHEGHLVVAEVALFALPQDEHTQDLAILDDGRAEEPVILLLAGIRDALVARMIDRVVQVDRLGALADQPDQPSAQLQTHPADRLRAQPVGRMQDMPTVVEVVEIDRADIGPDRLLYTLDDDGECALEIRGVVDLLHDAAKRFEHGRGLPRSRRGPGNRTAAVESDRTRSSCSAASPVIGRAGASSRPPGTGCRHGRADPRGRGSARALRAPACRPGA